MLAADIKALKAAPGQDLDNLKDKYKLDESGAANISKLLFGDQAGDLTTQGLFYYNKVKPLLESNKEEKRVRLVGRYVHFRSDNPTPDFLLRDAHIDVQLSFGHLLAKLQNVTHQMHITNKPATLTVRGTKLQKVKSVAIDGVFNHINPKHGSDLITFKVDDIDMGEMQLVKSSKLPIAITHANIDINGKILLNNGLQVYTDAQFDPVQFNSHADSTLGKMFAVAFTGIKSFYISGDISSDFKKHTIKIKSDMDDQIKQSLKDQWDTRIAAFRQKLRDKLDAEEQKIRGRVEAELAKLEAKKQDLEAKLARSEELLKAKVDEFKGQLDQKKDAAMDSLKNKLKR